MSESGKVVQTAPILKWMRGKPAVSCLGWARQRGYEVLELE